MRVVASARALDVIAERGGRIYVWTKRARCCGGLTTMATASDPPPGMEFERAESAPFELFLPANLRRPGELHVDVNRSGRRIEAYWNGCAWVC
jgi:hypothetical protein